MEKKLTTEEYLKQYFSKELAEIKEYKTRKERIYHFLKAIGFSPEEPILIDVFNTSCMIKKITYKTISENMSSKYASKGKNFVKDVLDDEFHAWIKRNPKIKEECKKISMTSIIKLFVRNYL